MEGGNNKQIIAWNDYILFRKVSFFSSIAKLDSRSVYGITKWQDLIYFTVKKFSFLQMRGGGACSVPPTLEVQSKYVKVKIRGIWAVDFENSVNFWPVSNLSSTFDFSPYKASNWAKFRNRDSWVCVWF